MSSARLEAISHLQQLMGVPVHVSTPALPGASNWVPLGPLAIPNGQTNGDARVLVTGRVTAIAVDPTAPQTLYLGAARGGVWKTVDGGSTWQPLSDHEVSLAIGALALAPSNPQVLYAGTGEGNLERYVQAFPQQSSPDNYLGNGVLKSLNGGSSWTRQGGPSFSGAGFFRLAVHPNDPNTAYAATSNGLFQTTDGGLNWNQLSTGLPAISASVIAATDVVIDPSSPSTVYAAFWGDGIYKTTTGGTANPTWTRQGTGFPSSDRGRMALGISPSSPSTLFALVADGNESVLGLYETTDGGGSWNAVPIAPGQITQSSSYTLYLAVDPTTPDIVYLSGTSLFKAVRHPLNATWALTEIGANIHPDNHCLAIDPANHLVLYAGTDGGIYRSADGGGTWRDTLNQGINICQFEFIDQHPASDAIVFGGTQDNGTEQFRNSPVFHHAADGDGGFVAVDPSDARNVLHEYYSVSPERSTQGGEFGTWADISGGLPGNALFYPPFALDQTNSNHIAFGSDRINLDSSQGTGGWPTQVSLPSLTGLVSAVNYVNDSLIYAGTTAGEIYRLVKTGASWTATALQAPPFPNRWVWDLAPLPTDVNTLIVVLSGFGTAHVWRGTVPASGVASWADISGVNPSRLPDIPVNALVIDPNTSSTVYIGTDIGVFRTTDGG
ncbi:MAG: hypothetical protein JO112_04330, partial [Planctomycetes bacterium]|nr:hypothetical protein [Planctomycetota bacterium]